MAKAENENRYDPIHLAWMVKKVALLGRGLGLAGKPDSPSRRAGWGLGSLTFVISWPTSFTIRTSRMGSLRARLSWSVSAPPTQGRRRRSQPECRKARYHDFHNAG
jgi:hypothetical protein